MKDLIKVGDIVCYGYQSNCKIGRVAQVLNFHKEYIIFPIKGANRQIKRNQDEIISANRLLLAQENSKYAR